MDTNNLEDIVSQIIRRKIFDIQTEFTEKVNQVIKESRERENQSDNEITKEFHRGVHVGMTHILLLFIKLKF